MGDPWDDVKGEVAQSLSEIDRLLAGGSAPGMRSKIDSLLDSVELDLGDLKETIAIVETQRERFQISDEELASRREFIRSTTAKISTARDGGLGAGGGSAAAAAGGGAAAASSSPAAETREMEVVNEREGLLGGPAKPKPGKSVRQQAAEAANEDAFDQHGQQMQLQIHEQDEVLDDLHGAVRRLKSMGGQMNEEISSQNRMISSLEGQIENVAGTMGTLKRKMTEMAQDKDRGKYCAILFLSMLLIFLTMLILN